MANDVLGEDLERDQIGIVPDHPYICASCGKEMKKVGDNLYKCPKCGQMFNEKSDE